MHDYKWLHEYCLNRFGSAAALEARLPQPRSTDELRAVPDDRYLSLISLRIFRAGLKHSLVDAKWPAFERAFFGFDPEKVVLMGGEHIERLMQDARLIRHLGKLKAYRAMPSSCWTWPRSGQLRQSAGGLAEQRHRRPVALSRQARQPARRPVGAAPVAHGRQGHLRAQ